MRGEVLLLIGALALTKGATVSKRLDRSDPAQATAICASADSNSILVAHERCNKFYICDNGRPVTFDCYGDLQYNPETEICDWPYTVDCGSRIIGEECDEESNPDPSSICTSKSVNSLVPHENCKQYYKCGNNGPVAYTCPGDLLYNDVEGYCDCQGNVVCGDRYVPEESDGGNQGGENNGNDNNNNAECNDDPSQAPSICAADGSDGVFVANENCNKFYQCANGAPVAFKCPGTLLYNPITETCDWPETVECGDRVIPEKESEENNNSNESENGGCGCNDNPAEAPTICSAEGSDGVFVAHENCNKFYQCANGSPVAFRCPGNLLYNPASEECDWPESVKCGDRTIPVVESEENDDSDESDNGNGGDVDSGNGGGGCGCNDNPAEAPTLCAAEGSDGVFVAHENCNKFYQCANGSPVVFRCPGTLLYNPATETCDWPETVNCGDRVIPAAESEENSNSGESDNGNGGDVDNGNGGGDNGNGGGEDNGNGDNGNDNDCNDDPSQAPALCAADGSDGVLVAHEKCNKFYKCANGLPVALRCPNNLLYDPRLEACDWPENVNCGDRVIPEPESEESHNSGESDNGNGGVVDNGNGGGDNGNGGGEDIGNGGCGCNDNPAEAPTVCSAEGSDGVFVAHENCNKFYQCANGSPVAFRCPGNLLYNPASEECDWPESVECGDRIIPDPVVESEENSNSGESDNGNGGGDNGNGGGDNGNGGGDNGNGGGGCGCNDNPAEAPTLCSADGSDGVFVAHENCNKFYQCANGSPVAFRCPGTLLYNPATETCDWPETVDCGDRVIPAAESEENSNSGESDNGNGGDVDNENGGGDNGNGGGGCGCNDNPAEAPTLCSADRSDGVFVAHENCNKFYQCANGSPVAFRCPGTLLYNPATETCDWPETVECGDRVIPAAESEENSNSGESDNGNGGDVDNGNGGGDNGNGGGDNGNGGGGCGCNDNPAEASTLCAAEGSNGVFVAHENCNKFYQCANGSPVVFRCPRTLLYNPVTETCDWPETVNCGDRVIPAAESEENSNSGESDNGNGGDVDNGNGGGDNGNGGGDNGNGGGGCGCNDNPAEAPTLCSADGSDGVFVAHENCNKFYQCANGSPVAFRCPGTLLYNPATETCDWPETVNCGDRVISAAESEENSNSGESDNGNGGDVDNGNGGGDNGNGGGEDIEDNSNDNDCNDDHSQAPALCAADGSDGVLVAHEKCNKFYQCANGLPVALRCPNNLLYDPRLEACDWPENVNCGDRVIPEPESEESHNSSESDNGNGGDVDNGNGGGDNGNGGSEDNGNGDNGNDNDCNDDPSQAPALCAADSSDGVLVAHEKCNKFYKCANGLPVALRCPNNLLYDPRLEACDWPENVNCGDRVIPEPESEESHNSGESDNGNGGDVDNGNGGGDNGNGGGEDNGNGDNGNDNDCNDDPSQAPALCAADGSDGVLVAHEKCNKFYKCANGLPVALRCPNNLLYDPRLEACDWPENVNCGDRVIPEPESDESHNSGESDNGNGGDVDNGNGGGDNGNDGGEDNGNGDNGNHNDCNDDPSQAPALCAADGSDGVLVAHEKCNKFYKCANGLPVALRCSNNLLYNPRLEACDWPENVNCGDRVIPEPESEESHNSGESDNGNGGDDNNGGDGDNGNGGEGDNGNGGVGCGCNNNPAEAPTICSADGSDGVFVAHEQCDKFYQCANGSPVTLSCPGTLLYNPSSETCDWPEKVDCGDRTSVPETETPESKENNNSEEGDDNNGENGGEETDGPSGCGCNGNPSEAGSICAAEGSNGVLVAHENCNQFYICGDGLPVVLTCPNTLLYNYKTERCDWADKVDCGNRVIPCEEDNGNDNNKSSEAEEERDEEAHPDAPGEAEVVCSLPNSEGKYIPHVNCHQFYICIGGAPITLSCPTSLLYDVASHDCLWPHYVECGNRVLLEDL